MRGAAHVNGILWVDFDKDLQNKSNNSLIKSEFQKFRYDNLLTIEEDDDVVKYMHTFISCISNPKKVKSLFILGCGNKDAVTNQVVEDAKEVNRHKHG